MKRVSILVSATAMAASALVAGQACSSSDTDQGVGNLMGTGGTTPVGAAGSVATPAAGAGGGSASGGTSPAPSGAAGTEGAPPLAPPAAGGSANAGAGVAGAAGGMADGEMSGAGAAGAPMGMGGSTGIPVPPPEAPCPATPSPTNGGMCIVTCTDDCGVFGIGARLCTCNNSVFACASCGFEGVDDPLLEPPAGALPPCDLIDEQQEDDASGCVENERCQSIGREDPDAAFANRFCACRDGEWDCDTKPASFP
jgi:hypothetical protein